MYSYLKNDIEKNYIELPYPLEPEFYEIGESWKDYLDGKWIPLTEEQVAYYKEWPCAVAEEIYNMCRLETLLPKKTLESVKEEVKMRIIQHDSSSEVNVFHVGEFPLWLDKATRAGLKLRFEAELALGVEETALWYEGYMFPLNVKDAMQMLYAIEVYASACYDNTQRHLAEVEKMTTIEDVEAYNYCLGYPSPLKF